MVLSLIAIAGIVYATADYLTSDPVIRKCVAYGETAGGVPVRILVSDDGTLQL